MYMILHTNHLMHMLHGVRVLLDSSLDYRENAEVEVRQRPCPKAMKITEDVDCTFNEISGLNIHLYCAARAKMRFHWLARIHYIVCENVQSQCPALLKLWKPSSCQKSACRELFQPNPVQYG